MRKNPCKSKSLFYQRFTCTPPWSGDPTCTGTPPTDVGGVPSQAGHGDATLQCGMWGALLGSPAVGQPPSRTRQHGTGSLLEHFPVFRQNLRGSVVSGSGSSISASEAAHSSPWALLWAQPRLLYNLGFPEKLKREMKDSYQPSPSAPPKPRVWGVGPVPALLHHSEERKPAQMGLEDRTHPQSRVLQPHERREGEAEPWFTAGTPHCSRMSSCWESLEAPGWGLAEQCKPGSSSLRGDLLFSSDATCMPYG